jgi:hypothetical protein
MQQSNAMLSQRESYAVTRWKQFLWWLSTVEEELIKDCVIDRNRYAITGMTVLCTWLFATFAWMYFFSIVVAQPLVFIALGLFMGFIILCIDRALIKGISGNNKRKIVPLLFRILLAATIGTFMAQPALLYLFKKEVVQQISIDNETRKQQKLKLQEATYTLQKQDWQNKKTQLQQQLNNKYAEVATARESFIAETDGTGGSKKIGLEAIAKTKKQAYELLLTEYNLLQQQLQPQITTSDSALYSISQAIETEQKSYTNLFNTGFLTQIEALNNLVKTNSALQYRYWLLLALLILIELMPVIAKTILPSGTYDKKIMARETIEAIILESNTQRETELKELYNQLAFDADQSFIKEFIASGNSKRSSLMKDATAQWNSTKEQSFDDFWNTVKQQMLLKQEH